MATATKTRKPATKKAAAKPSTIAEIDWKATLIAALNSPGALGNTFTRFYNYSFLNQIRLMMQGVNEPVATYRRWSELGFQVQKGSKAKTVLAPVLVTKRDKETGKPVLTESGKTQQILIGFKESHTVFAFSDTDGEELPEIAYPAWDLEKALAALGIKREKFRTTDGNTAGYSHTNKAGQKFVAVNPATTYPAHTMLHEIAHMVLGHTAEEYRQHRGIMEFEAEATAHLLAIELQLSESDWDASESRAYLDHWVGNDLVWDEEIGTSNIDNADKHYARVFSAVNKILVAGRPVAETE